MDNIIKEDYKELIVVLVFEVIKGVVLVLQVMGVLGKNFNLFNFEVY